MKNIVSLILLGVVAALVTVGVMVLASTSSIKGMDEQSDPYFFLAKQAKWLAIALLIGIATARFDYHHWRDHRLYSAMMIGTFILLLLVFVPGIGAEIKGSHRWLKLGPMTFQPSELAKLSAILCLSRYVVKTGWRMSMLKYSLGWPMLGIAPLLLLILAEPDFGTTVLVGVITMSLLFAGGMKARYLAIAVSFFLVVILGLALISPVRSERIWSFLNPEAHPKASYQLIQSKVAFIRGEWDGVGLGNSMQKQFYLPEAYTDFILPIIGEELGLIASGGVLLGFAVFMLCGVYISYNAPDLYGRLVAFGITVWITGQAIINIAVVSGCAPTKGMALPFISYGGSSMVMLMAAVGVLINIAKHCSEGSDKHTVFIRDNVQDF